MGLCDDEIWFQLTLSFQGGKHIVARNKGHSIHRQPHRSRRLMGEGKARSARLGLMPIIPKWVKHLGGDPASTEHILCVWDHTFWAISLVTYNHPPTWGLIGKPERESHSSRVSNRTNGETRVQIPVWLAHSVPLELTWWMKRSLMYPKGPWSWRHLIQFEDDTEEECSFHRKSWASKWKVER